MILVGLSADLLVPQLVGWFIGYLVNSFVGFGWMVSWSCIFSCSFFPLNGGLGWLVACFYVVVVFNVSHLAGRCATTPTVKKGLSQ
jgi:hypothetical protein